MSKLNETLQSLCEEKTEKASSPKIRAKNLQYELAKCELEVRKLSKGLTGEDRRFAKIVDMMHDVNVLCDAAVADLIKRK